MERMRLSAVLIVLAVGLGTGCSKKAPAPAAATSSKYTQDALAAGGTLNSDGSVTNANGSVTEPNGTVVPAGANPPNAGSSAPPNATPSAQTATTKNPAPIERVAPPVTAPAGTPVTIRTTEELSTRVDAPDQRFTAVLERPVVSHGIVVFKRGTPVAGEILGEKNKGTFAGAGHMSITLIAIDKEPVRTTEYTAVAKGRGKRTGAFIGGGGGLGALIGGLAGGGKGALIGGLAGAGAGTVGSATGNKDVVIRPETVITFHLRAPVSR
jgi:hypothetical protein